MRLATDRSPLQTAIIHEIHTAMSIVVATVVTIAIELAMLWNEFSEANNLTTAAQLTPMLVSDFRRHFYAFLILSQGP